MKVKFKNGWRATTQEEKDSDPTSPKYIRNRNGFTQTCDDPMWFDDNIFDEDFIKGSEKCICPTIDIEEAMKDFGYDVSKIKND